MSIWLNYTNNRQTWDTRSPLAAEAVQAMGMSQAKKEDPHAVPCPREFGRIPSLRWRYHDAAIAQLQQAIEAVWALGYDDPANVVDDVHDEAKRWLRGFTDLCHCNRPPRECVCP